VQPFKHRAPGNIPIDRKTRIEYLGIHNYTYCNGMSTVFVFPPQASPTYVPLGLASIAAYLRENHPDARFRILDLNLQTWNTKLHQLEPEFEMSYFIRVHRDDFFTAPIYQRYLTLKDAVGERIHTLYQEAKVYIETGTPSSGMEKFLEESMKYFQTGESSTPPQLIGFSVMFPKQLIFALALSKRAKKMHPLLKIVLGGAALSTVEGEEILAACPYVDAIVIGEGEVAAGMLLAGRDEREIPGLISRKGRNLKPDTMSMNCLPFPDFSVFPLDLYWNPSPVLPVLFSRGCRWRKCRFCAHNFSFSGYRTRSVAQFADQLAEYKRLFGAEHFYFADQYIDVLDLESIADVLLRRDLRIHFHCMGRPTRDNTRARLEKIAFSGLRWVSWGVETGSQRLLELCGKGTLISEIAQVLRDSHSVGIHNLLMMIFGLPTSSDEDLAHTFEFVERLSCEIHEMKESVFCLMKNTGFAKNARSYGLKITGAQELFQSGGRRVHSFKLDFREIGADGSTRPPRGPMELGIWEKRKKWIFEDSPLRLMSAEHSLLAVSAGGTPPCDTRKSEERIQFPTRRRDDLQADLRAGRA